LERSEAKQWKTRRITPYAVAGNSDLKAIQIEMSQGVELSPLPEEEVRHVLGIDVQYEAFGAMAAAVMLERVSLEQLNTWHESGEAGQGYEHGFLAFRELPAVLSMLARVDEMPDVILYDGNGILHPRGLGAASHLGVLLDIPTIGVSKNISAYRPFVEVERGETRIIENGNGALLVTRDQTNPVCVSPGHRVDLDSAIQLVLTLSKTRIPEPIRLADQLARHCARNFSQTNNKPN